MYQSYDLSRYIDGDLSKSTSITVSDDDAINCAHMLAAGFNTMSRNFMGDFALAVVDTKITQIEKNGAASKYEFITRPVLEDAYAEMQAVKSVVEEIGVETIPLSSGVREMQYMIENRDEQIADLKQALVELTPARSAANEAARAELIEYVKGERAKWLAADKRAPVNHEHMNAWFRGVLDVLAKFLVVTGEADASEGHAVARRLCGISDE